MEKMDRGGSDFAHPVLNTALDVADELRKLRLADEPKFKVVVDDKTRAKLAGPFLNQPVNARTFQGLPPVDVEGEDDKENDGSGVLPGFERRLPVRKPPPAPAGSEFVAAFEADLTLGQEALLDRLSAAAFESSRKTDLRPKSGTGGVGGRRSSCWASFPSLVDLHPVGPAPEYGIWGALRKPLWEDAVRESRFAQQFRAPQPDTAS